MEKIREKTSKFKSEIWIFVFFIVISTIFLMPIFFNIHNLGIGDWDGRFASSAIQRESILKYYQFPLWNPYICGGMPMLAHPESSFFSPFFIFILIFGEVIGLKVLVLLHMVLGLVGMFIFSRYYGLGRKASFFSSIIFMMSSYYALHIAVGHPPDYFVMAYIPFAFLFYLRTIKSKSLKEKFANATFSSLFILLLLLYGSTNLVIYLAMFMVLYSIIESIIRKKINPMIFCVIILVVGALLGSIKLFPVISFLNDNNLEQESSWEGNNLDILFTSLLSRDQTYDRKISTQHGWWEYSAYIGFIPLLLAFFGVYSILRRKKRLIPLILLPAFFLIIYFGNASPLNIWIMLHKIPILSFFRVPSRVIVFILLCTAILSGEGIDRILAHFQSGRKRGIKRRIYHLINLLIIFVIVVVFIDLTLVSRPALSKAFPFEQPELERTDKFQSTNILYNYTGQSNSYVYTSFLRNKGAMNSIDCAVERVNIPTKGSAIPRESPLYKGEVYLASGRESIKLEYYSPNKIIVVSDTEKTDRIVLNQNYYSGWRSNIGKVELYNGLVSVPVKEGRHTVELYYLPASFIIGLIVQIFVVIGWMVAFFMIFYNKQLKNKKKQG